MLAAALAGAAPAAAPPTFATLRWTAPGSELAALTAQPRACLTDASVDVLAGQALFASPAILGGQAAKAGLSCASCHDNGRDNPHFQMPSISDRPGSADVTSSFFSAVRGNARFDPVVIPDLALPGKVARDPAAGALEPFIRVLIVEEFAGPEPAAAVLAALAAYVRAIAPCAQGDARVARSVDDPLRLVAAGVHGAASMAHRDDPAAARALIAAARHQLGHIAERYPAPAFRAEQRDLLAASRSLQMLASSAENSPIFAMRVTAWLSRFEGGLARRLRAKEDRSLYNRRNLGFVALQRE